MTGWYAQLMRAAKQDPKKAGILLVLVLVMLGAWFKILAGGPAGPSRVVADIARPGAAGSAGQQTAPPPGTAAQTSRTMLHEWTRIPVTPLDRNLFAVRLEYFPREAGREGPAAAAVTNSDGFWDQLAKSMSTQADQRRERQILVENLQRQANQLRLQTTIMGEKPKALIDGELVGEGDVVGSFRVLKIEPRRVVVEREGVRLEIPMR